jgi:hypothetical protein
MYHGDGCTCTRLEPITFEPVVVSDDCPRRDDPASSGVVLTKTATPVAIPKQLEGRVIITWPGRWPGIVPVAAVTIEDADTGEFIVAVTDLRIHIGYNSAECAVAELFAIVDDEGKILGPGKQPAVAEDGAVRTATFWRHIAEMRIS